MKMKVKPRTTSTFKNFFLKLRLTFLSKMERNHGPSPTFFFFFFFFFWWNFSHDIPCKAQNQRPPSFQDCLSLRKLCQDTFVKMKPQRQKSSFLFSLFFFFFLNTEISLTFPWKWITSLPSPITSHFFFVFEVVFKEEFHCTTHPYWQYKIPHARAWSEQCKVPHGDMCHEQNLYHMPTDNAKFHMHVHGVNSAKYRMATCVMNKTCTTWRHVMNKTCTTCECNAMNSTNST